MNRHQRRGLQARQGRKLKAFFRLRDLLQDKTPTAEKADIYRCWHKGQITKQQRDDLLYLEGQKP